MKRTLDLVLAGLLLVLLAPLLLAVALLVIATSPGPALHRRRVVGLGGVEFDAFKFRTMRADADRWLEERPELKERFTREMKLRDDPRVTAAGAFLRKTSIDELPQLLNVLRGEMSLVGPRMVTRDELPRFGALAERRLTVRPGITGLWQVSGRQEMTYAERAELDRRYLDERSLALDLMILLRTPMAVLSMRGAY